MDTRACPRFSRRLRKLSLLSAFLLLLAVTPAGAQQPEISLGTVVGSDYAVTPLQWVAKGLTAAPQSGGSLRLEVAPKAKGTLEAQLPVQPQQLYHLSFTCRRGPGTTLGVAVSFLDAEKKPDFRGMVFQLPDAPRPNWWPLSPFRQEYVQQFILPPGAHNVLLQVTLTGHPEAGYNYLELYGVKVSHRAPVPFGGSLGPNLLVVGDLEAKTPTGTPLGWGTWVGTPEKMDILQKDDAGNSPHGGNGFLRVSPGKYFILVAPNIPIEIGRAYRVTLWMRGKAEVGFGVQSLADTRPIQQRVGDAQQKGFRIDATNWTPYVYTWYAEALYTVDGQLFMGIHPQSEFHLDDITFQRIEAKK
ncbi:MAG: carbohydrate binding domain-containing protein [Armatimonadota bacterium]